jgi:hypothetical protein
MAYEEIVFVVRLNPRSDSIVAMTLVHARYPAPIRKFSLTGSLS